MPGDDSEYEAYLKYLYDRDVAPAISRLKSQEISPGWWDYGFTYPLARLAKADAMLRLIAANPDVYSTFRAQALAGLIEDAAMGVESNSRILSLLGIADTLDSEYRTLATGMRSEHLPAEEAALLRSSGFLALADSWPGLVYLARAHAEESAAPQREIRLSAELGNLAGRLHEAARDHERLGEIEEELAALKHAQKAASAPAKQLPNEKRLTDEAESKKKPRRWWKGLGQVVSGAALSLADTAFVAGPHVVVTAPAFLVSVTAGIGTIMQGVGDLQGE
jgi:hypothetical protein